MHHPYLSLALQSPMSLFNLNHPHATCRRYRQWKANLTLRHGWFRVLLHLTAMIRRPRNVPWHWQHITHEFHDPTPRA
jgi:hypothetical protein